MAMTTPPGVVRRTITRRAIIVTVFLLATPLAAAAQPAGKVPRVGILSIEVG